MTLGRMPLTGPVGQQTQQLTQKSSNEHECWPAVQQIDTTVKQTSSSPGIQGWFQHPVATASPEGLGGSH